MVFVTEGIVIILLSFGTITIMATAGFKNSEHGKKLAEANSQFALDAFRALSAQQNDNIFFSPGSISIALAMTYLGARNNTADQMKKTMSLTELEDDHIHSTFEDLFSVLSDTGDNYTLHIANRIFAEKSYSFLQNFMDAQKKHYKASLADIDFKNNFDAARQEINQWVETQTADKIKDLLPSGSIDSLTRMVLVNAIYFKGNWAQKFDAGRTKPGEFWLNAQDKIEVPMMHQKEHFKLGMARELDDCKVLELPYKGNKLSMYIILPSKADGLAALESKLTLEHLSDPEKAFKMRKVEVQVTLPKFKLEQSFDLGETLQNLGMKDLFDEARADFSGIDGTRNLFVSKVVHKAFINLDEEGSEAAAATGVQMQMRSLPKIFPFVANKPFLFLIREQATSSILFLGKMVNPGTGISGKDEL